MKKVRCKKCKICGLEFLPRSSFAKVCSVTCAMQFAKEQAEKEKIKQQKAREKAERAKIKQVRENLKSRADWLKDLQKVFNQFIRLRDKDLPCISCGRFHQGQWHAGHYRTTKACPELRFNEENCHKQCQPCNTHLSGNITEYRINLVQKIGLERVEWLERKDHKPLKLSIDEIKELIRVYKAKCKELM
ncbi:recombination protein NinG [Lonepinella koalarum]|uniref:recombination protein NinG n=1 Tax=Lonepinella koalarum TaxID=53417 RepID=UPI003F6E2B2E